MLESAYVTSEHVLLRDQVARFVAEDVEPLGAKWEDDGCVPREVLRKMGSLGFFGLMYSPDFGGGDSDPVTNLVFATTEKFRSANPRTYAAVSAALFEAIAWVNADKKRAAELYIAATNEKKLSVEDVTALISVPGFDFTKTPKKTFAFAEFMHRIGTLKTKPESWKDLYFPEAHGETGD